MRVLFLDVQPAAVRHVYPGTHPLAHALLRLGHRVTVLTHGDAPAPRLHRSLIVHPVGGLGYPAWRIGDTTPAQWPVWWLMQRIRPDVLVVNRGADSTYDSSRHVIAFASRVPWILCAHRAEDLELVDALPASPNLVIVTSADDAVAARGLGLETVIIPLVIQMDADGNAGELLTDAAIADFEAALITVTEAHRAPQRRKRGLRGRPTVPSVAATGPGASAPDHETQPRPALASVIIPARNVASTIDAQLAALSAQTYEGDWEVVVIDNGSTDDTSERAAAWSGRVPGLRIVAAGDRRGVAHARNVGLREAHGEFVLICDGDDVVTPNWLRAMVDALRQHDVVTGALDRRALNQPEQYEWGGDADLDDAEVGYGFLRYASGGNLGIRREVARILAGFDESMRGGEDIDFSWRGHYAGYRVHFVREGVIRYRLRPGLRALTVARFRIGRVEPLLYRRHRRRGMPRASAAEVRDTYAWLLRTAPRLLADRSLRYRWVAAVAQRSGRVVGSVRHRALFL